MGQLPACGEGRGESAAPICRFVTRQAERPAMLAYSGAGVVLYTFDDATDGHMCLLLLEEVGVGSHRPSRHRWRDPHFKNGNQLTLSLPGGQLPIGERQTAHDFTAKWEGPVVCGDVLGMQVGSCLLVWLLQNGGTSASRSAGT